jgi:hypothetical protein
MARAALSGRAVVNGSVAPVCPITRSEVPPSQPGIKVPYVAKATSPEDAVRAVNQLIDAMAAEETATIRWPEKERVTAIVRIFNPEDDSQWVDVLRIQKLVMEDQITGDLWVWELGQPHPTNPNDAASQLYNLYYSTGGDISIITTPPTNPPAG